MEDILDIINGVAFISFVALTALAVMRMTLRVIIYRLAGRSASIILKRDLVLLGALLFTFGAPVVIQFFGWGDEFFEGGTLRLPYTIVRDLVGVGGLAYWVWVEYFVIGNKSKEAE